MYRGINFKVPNQWGTLLFDILHGTSYDNFTWKIVEDEVYVTGGNFLFTSDTLNGQSFKKIISSDPYYVVFANLQAFPNENAICEINNYSDYMNSECEIVILVCDNIFVDIYTKNQHDIELLEKNALKHGFSEIKMLTDKNDSRNLFNH